MRNRMMRNMGVGIGRVGMSGSISSSSKFGSTLRYYRMRCETEHKLAACPNCGSKMKRVGSSYLKHKIQNKSRKKLTLISMRTTTIRAKFTTAQFSKLCNCIPCT
jgi:hypothetical protein